MADTPSSDEMQPLYDPGCTVYLRSGSPPLTVIHAAKGPAGWFCDVAWLSEGVLHKWDGVPEECLTVNARDEIVRTRRQ